MKIFEIGDMKGSAAGLRTKRRGPKRGESVGGVCPDRQ